MKNPGIQKLFYLLVFFTVLFASCKDKPSGDPQPNPESCKLTKLEFYENGLSDGSAINFEYNSQGYVVKFTETESNPVVVVGLINYVYNSSNQLIREDYLQDTNRIRGSKTYEYNTNGTVSRTVDQETGEQERTETYTYDANKRLTQVIATDQGNSSKTTYQYLGNSENVGTVSYYDANDEVIGTTTFENYDDKLSPIHALKGPVLIGTSKNNPGKVTYTSIISGLLDESVSYSYKYNAAGFISEQIEKEAGKAFEYKTVFTYTGCK